MADLGRGEGLSGAAGRAGGMEEGTLAAAVQGQAGAADVGGLRRGQEQAGGGHVVRGGHPLQRDGGGDGGGGFSSP